MAALIGSLVHELSTSTGTGNFTIELVNARRRFSEHFATGGTDTLFYAILSRVAHEWEYGTGHLVDDDTLARDTVLASSNAGAAVDFTAGTKDVLCDHPAEFQLGGDTPTLTAHLLLSADATHDIGTTTVGINDLHFGANGVVNFDNGDVTLTHVGAEGDLELGGGNFALDDNALRIRAAGDGNHELKNDSGGLDGPMLKGNAGINFATNQGSETRRMAMSETALYPWTDDGMTLGITSTNEWSDLFLASGAVIGFDNSDVTLTHSANLIAHTGGRLIIGQATIEDALENESGNNIQPDFQIGGTTSQDNSCMGLIRYAGATSGNGPRFIFGRSGSSSWGTPGTVADNYMLGMTIWDGDDGTTFVPGAIIGARVDGTPGTNAMPTELFFRVNSGGGTPTERFALRAAGVLEASGLATPGAITTPGSINAVGLYTEGRRVGMDLLASGTTSNAAALDIAIDQYGDEYIAYKFILTGVQPATDGNEIFMRFSTDGGSTFDSGASYWYGRSAQDEDGDGEGGAAQGATQVNIAGGNGVGNVGAQALSFELTLTDPQDGTFPPKFWQQGAYIDPGEEETFIHGMAGNYSANDITDVRFFASASNISVAHYQVYGIRK